jgi:hypothetical protein
MSPGRRTRAVAVIAGCALGLATSAAAVGATTATTTTTTATTTTTTATTLPALASAPSQPDPTNLWDSTPIPAVVAAARAARADEPLPDPLLPSIADLFTSDYDTPADCQPAFPGGVEPPLSCRLADAGSRTTVAILGDSHAAMWTSAIVAAGEQRHFAVAPLAKPGCQLIDYDTNTDVWPCHSWYSWALAEDKRLHPAATIVSFLIQDAWEKHPAVWVRRLSRVLSQVVNPVLVADMPYQNQYPANCVTSPTANLGTCSSPVPSSYTPFMRAVAAMAAAQRVSVIPTKQWFCADGTCPMIVNDTIVLRDKDHLSEDYVDELTPLFDMALNPILAGLEDRAR